MERPAQMMEAAKVLLVFSAVAAFGYFMRKPLFPALEERDRDSVLFHLDKIKEQDFDYVVVIGVRGCCLGVPHAMRLTVAHRLL